MRTFSTGLKNPFGKGEQLIVVHIGTEKEFVNNNLWVFTSHSARKLRE
jgi:hypothetical protein